MEKNSCKLTEALSRQLSGWTEENYKNVKSEKTGVRAKTRTENTSNTTLKRGDGKLIQHQLT